MAKETVNPIPILMIEDEREIESLRRALRQLHEPRDAGRERRGAPLTNTRLQPGEKERPD